MKMIAIDMDGTLLDSCERVTNENAKAIRRAQEKGIEVVIATGRTFYTAANLLKKAKVKVPIICLNGADIRDHDGKQLASAPIDYESFIKIEKACTKHGVHFEVCTNHCIYSISKEQSLNARITSAKSAHLHFHKADVIDKFYAHVSSGYVKLIDSFHQLLEQNIEIYKVLAFSCENEKLLNIKDELAHEETLHVTSSGRNNLEINHANAQKGSALEKFAAEKGVAMKDVLAIGDHFNDLSMLKKAGKSVAMGNAEEEVKKICDFITKTNNEHGVAYAIEKMLKE